MNKKARAKLAKDTINILIPHILQTNSRARTGVGNSKLIRYNPSLVSKQAPAPPAAIPIQDSAQEAPPPATAPPTTPPQIRVIKSDTFSAAHSILTSTPTKNPKIAVLNMASPLRPGGGVLNGARAQEESLCLRSTLYAALHESFYRLPELSAVYSPDVLVFRSSDNAELAKKEWFFVDVISCAALRFPETVVEEKEGKVAERRYQNDGQREAMVCRVRTVVQAAAANGVTHLVLGALGCGAYGNPPREVARIFKKVLCGDRKRRGVTVEESGIEEIVFAIFDEGENLRTFREEFKDVSSSDAG
jgi:uncharacterized protein (TIGR02452 family)